MSQIKLQHAEGERKRSEVNQFTELQVETNKSLLTSWMHGTVLNQLLGNYLKKIANYQMPLHPAYAWTFQTFAHNQLRSRNYFVLTDYAPVLACASLFLPALIHSQCKFFQNNLYLSPPEPLYKKASPFLWPSSILLCKKRRKFCGSMDGPGEYYAKWNKPVRER